MLILCIHLNYTYFFCYVNNICYKRLYTKRYLKLQIKRGLKHLHSILAITLLLAVCISLACALIITQNNENESQKKIKIGITGDLSQTYLGIGITAIETMDTSRFSIEFITMEEEVAQKRSKRWENFRIYKNSRRFCGIYCENGQYSDCIRYQRQPDRLRQYINE